ncbi:hypothetical protein E2562_032606 [Oryza meyeriana var. granulata]|uniref:Uncharacterized protein n=1 Tax=Oryza meyeriana var. granulata TaxID=110450 RepID=A0A6G1E6C5_9ORYZ|nr:hypothetical protein E2562_032606 [Oryza meyeriana var. granulata]
MATASDVYGSDREQQLGLARAAEDGKPRRRPTDRGKKKTEAWRQHDDDDADKRGGRGTRGRWRCRRAHQRLVKMTMPTAA